MSNRRIGLAIVIVCALVATGQTSRAQARTRVMLDSLALSVGESGIVEGRIECGAADGCGAFAIAILFDPALVRADEVEVGPYLGPEVIVAEKRLDNESGTIRLAAAALGAVPELGAPVLLRLHLTALAPGMTALSVTDLQVGDLIGNPLNAEGISGAVVVTERIVPLPTLAPVVTSAPTLAPAPVSFFAAGSSNRDWTPVVREFDGLPFAYVPAGCFMMGSTDEQVEVVILKCEDVSGDCSRSWFAIEQPAHEVCLSAFWIGQTEVTNAQYRQCVDAGACDPPTDTTDYSDPAYADHPVVNVSWDQADDYATWGGYMLPTEAQWEYAARGPEAWVYPWGNEFDGTRLNYCDGDCPHEWRDPDQVDGFARTASVETLPQGASWVGALHMSGNVWEWDADWYDELYYGTLGAMTQDPTGPATGSTHGVRSSAWSNYAVFTHAARRASNCPPDLVGFRVAAAFPAP